jgi:uncharacterized protein YqcC (DUF446 family)
MTRLNIRKYQERIESAKAALHELPINAYGWAAQKQLNEKRQALLDEIKHVENLIRRCG